MKKLLENECLYSEFCTFTGNSAKDIEEAIRQLSFRGAKKMGEKMMRFYRKGELKDGMVLTLKERELPIQYAGKVIMTEESLALDEIQIYLRM
ncbi:hypothetical protein IDE33_002629 [Enterococcus faecalis]|nr:hypothetical protein [Enterococcus faecalis]